MVRRSYKVNPNSLLDQISTVRNAIITNCIILIQWIALKVRSDWLVKLRISFVFYLRSTQEKMASRFASVKSKETIQLNDETVPENTQKAIFTLLELRVVFPLKISRSFDHLMYYVTFWAACCFSPLSWGKDCNRCWNM